MTPARTHCSRGRRQKERGYTIVLVVVIIAFASVAGAMQILVLASVGITGRAFDAYRQGATEIVRLERVTAEALLDVRQVSVAAPASSIATALDARLLELSAGGATVTATTVPATVPAVVTFPNSAAVPEQLVAIPVDLQTYLTPELARMIGPRVVAYPPLTFEFSSTRSVLDAERTYPSEVNARLIAVPLTRFPVAAYDLPEEIGSTSPGSASVPASDLPGGLVPGRDEAFATELQSQSGTLPYAYRHRAVLAAAYQYVFSQQYLDRVSEYAGITHFRNMDAVAGTATFAGMTQAGRVSSWDLGTTGAGSYGTVTLTKDAYVIHTQENGRTLRLFDSLGSSVTTPLLILVLGPTDAAVGTLTLQVETISRPVVIVGYNVQVTFGAGTALNGALILDRSSSVVSAATLDVGHFSYWAGSTAIPLTAVRGVAMPHSAEALAPRVVYVATQGRKLW